MKQIIEELLQQTTTRGTTSWQEVCRDAQAVLTAEGLPTIKTEAWRYTSLAKLPKDLTLGASGEQEPVLLPELEGYQIILDDTGIHAEEIPGVTVRFGFDHALAGTIASHTDGILAMNTLAVQGIGIIEVASEVQLEKPLCIHVRGGVQLVHTRLLLQIGAGACVTIIEEQTGTGVHNHIVEARVHAGAELRYYVQQSATYAGTALNARYLQLAEGVRGEYAACTLGTTLVRNHIDVQVVGEQVEFLIGGISVGRGSAVLDTQVQVTHMVPNARTEQCIRGVFDEESKGIFQGRIWVAEGAHHTSAGQQSKQLLLSRQATVNVQPQLEIYNDDVRCAHGASTGFMDEDMLFYLRSRGISKGTARGILVESFLADVLRTVSEDAVRALWTDHVHGYSIRNYHTDAE